MADLFMFIFIFLFGVAGVMIGMLIGRNKQQVKEDPASGWPRRQVCYYAKNQQIWQMGRHMEVGMLVTLTPGGEPLEVKLDVHHYVIDPKTDERVYLIYG